jgi:hypothetical protein
VDSQAPLIHVVVLRRSESARILKRLFVDIAARAFLKIGGLIPCRSDSHALADGLAEIAINQGRADRDLGLSIGAQIGVVS